MIKIKLYVDYSISFFKEIATSALSRHCVVETNNLLEANLALVLQKPSEIRKTIEQIKRVSNLPILTTPNAYLLDYGVYFFNDRLMDLNVNIFLNNLCGIENDVMHVDCQFRYKGINLRSEMVGILTVIDQIHEITNVKYSFNDNNCVHLTGYDNDRTFTFSCFISNCSNDFDESFTVYTRNNGIFKLNSGDIGEHTYTERYGASVDLAIENVVNGKCLKQNNIFNMLKIDRSLGGTSSSRLRGAAKKRPRLGISPSPKFRSSARSIIA